MSQAMLVCVLLVLVSTVDADIELDYRECMNSQESVNELTLCTEAFPGPRPVIGLFSFMGDPQIKNYCRNYTVEYIQWLECYISVQVNCYKTEHQDLTLSISALRSAIEYFCKRDADGYKFDTACAGFTDNPELQECIRNNEITTPSGNISYEGFKYNLCRSRQVSLTCIRNDEKLKTVCPDTQTTYSTVYEKESPPACDAGNDGNSGNSGNKLGIWNLIVMTFLISLFNN